MPHNFFKNSDNFVDIKRRYQFRVSADPGVRWEGEFILKSDVGAQDRIIDLSESIDDIRVETYLYGKLYHVSENGK